MLPAVHPAHGLRLLRPDSRAALSLPLRLNLISLVFTALVALALTALGGYQLHDQQADNAANHARLAADELALRADQLMDLELKLQEFVAFDEQCQEVLRSDPLLRHAALFGPDLKRRFASHGARPEWPTSLDPTQLTATKRWETAGGRIAVQPVLQAGQPMAYALVAVDDRAVLQATLARVAWLVACAVLLLAAGLLLQRRLLWRSVGQPLAGLVQMTDGIRPDDPGSLAALQSPPEGTRAGDDIGRVHHAFARLVQRLVDARAQLLDYNSQLEATVRDRTLRLELANAELACDIDRRQQLEEELRRQATTDALTGLANRAFVLPHAEQRLRLAHRQGQSLGLMLLDFDGFKAINDTHGHAAGDAVLRAMAQRLSTTGRASDTLARLGGDEFLLVFDGTGGQATARALALRLIQQFEAPLQLDEPPGLPPLQLGVSIGAALSPTDGVTLELLMAAADAAMYAAKQAGGGWRLAAR